MVVVVIVVVVFVVGYVEDTPLEWRARLSTISDDREYWSLPVCTVV